MTICDFKGQARAGFHGCAIRGKFPGVMANQGLTSFASLTSLASSASQTRLEMLIQMTQMKHLSRRTPKCANSPGGPLFCPTGADPQWPFENSRATNTIPRIDPDGPDEASEPEDPTMRRMIHVDHFFCP